LQLHQADRRKNRSGNSPSVPAAFPQSSIRNRQSKISEQQQSNTAPPSERGKEAKKADQVKNGKRRTIVFGQKGKGI